jgi:hypothetical protein
MSFDFYVSIFTCGCKYRKKKCIVQILLFSYSKRKMRNHLYLWSFPST